LGNLFKYKNKQKSKTNLMVFLRPTILRDAAVTTQISSDKYNFMRGLQMEARDLDEDELKEIMPTADDLLQGGSTSATEQSISVQ
jgi:general secretion pathway protein D